MRRRRRNMVLIWLIGLGLINFMAYTVAYAYIGGDARNGRISEGHYYVRGHFLHDREGHAQEVSRRVWLYSYIHSVSIWPTIGIVLCAMLVLARPHIIATMSEDSVLGGRSFVTVVLTVIMVLIIAVTTYFLLGLLQALDTIREGSSYGEWA